MSGAARRVPSIAVPIFLLVIISVALGTFALFAVTFVGPPPRAAPVPLPALAEALRSLQPLPDDEQSTQVFRSGDLPTLPPDPFDRRGQPEIAANLAKLLGAAPGQVMVSTFEPQPSLQQVRGPFFVGWHAPDGWRVARTAPPRWLSRWHLYTAGAMIVALIVLGFIAWWVAQAISRPLTRLAEATRGARMGARATIPRGGPREVVALADALEHMQDRLVRQAEGRTAMLAAIAHDLGTPLARLAFRVEQLPEAGRDRAAADIAEMRAMLAAVLRLTRDERAAPHVRLDLGSLIDSVAQDFAAAGDPVASEAGPRIVVLGDSGALRRLLGNLIGNAVRYGESATICWAAEHDGVEVTIDDEGPGFPLDAERLFEPFVRGEPSRNRATGGTGLGLAIARSIAEAHGGSVSLANRPEGGGRARLWLPGA